MSEPRVLVPLAEGVEEMEAVIVIDVLRRAGADVRALGLDQRDFVTASRGVRLGVDAQLVGDEEADAIVLPGGAGGAERLAADERVRDMLRRFEKEERWIGAICAAPSVLVAAEVGAGKTMTSHPSVREQVEAFAGSYVEDAVAFDPQDRHIPRPRHRLRFCPRPRRPALRRRQSRRSANPHDLQLPNLMRSSVIAQAGTRTRTPETGSGF
jgi:4-methyl-5(b-hydroxyethyl)-thiazole monophosphate biosynthesis